MARLVPSTLIAGLIAGLMLAACPAFAQDNDAELDGAPPPLQVPKEVPKELPKPSPKITAPKVTAPKPAAAAPKAAPPRVTTSATADASLKAEQARLTRQADAQKAEQDRLARLAADLDAQKDRLDARATELAANEARLVRQREDLDADYARKLAELDRDRTPSRPPAAAPPPASAQADTLPHLRVSYDEARRACTRAGMSEAVDHDFFSARYDAAPRFFERQREMRGRMRLDDREGYLTVDTVCQLDANGAVLRFEVIR